MEWNEHSSLWHTVHHFIEKTFSTDSDKFDSMINDLENISSSSWASVKLSYTEQVYKLHETKSIRDPLFWPVCRAVLHTIQGITQITLNYVERMFILYSNKYNSFFDIHFIHKVNEGIYFSVLHMFGIIPTSIVVEKRGRFAAEMGLTERI